ncbi:MAG: ABC transporter ATP-binding protein [Rhodobacteraceae bacterium]|nr:ABC transporter ATP-binding protein [Paracoccaceae bacterium]
MAFLELSNLVKTFGANCVVKDFDLSIDRGELVSLLGPSGCGKTTVLRMVAGFETPTAGTIKIDGHDVTAQKPNERAIGLMFQAYALFPNMTVADNVAFGLKVKGVARAERDKVVVEMLRLIGLPDLGGRFPFQLSGGQQQRVALARALAVRPRLLLLDEPLSALDAKIRLSLRTEIREIQRELGITAIFVTHDQEEALSMSDRVVVMNGGIAEQIGTPFEVYSRPTTRFVATFVGTLNLFEAEAEGAGALRINGVTVRLPDEIEATRGGRLTVALRPESLHLGAGEVTLPATVEGLEFLGSILRIKARVAGTQIALDTFNRADAPPPAVGTKTLVSFAARDLVVLNA